MKRINVLFGILCAVSTASLAETQEQMLQLVNQARSQERMCGDEHFSAAPPLKLNNMLQLAAEKHAKDMAEKNYFDHDSLDGRDPFDRMEDEGYEYSTAAENIAKGNKNAQSAINSWLDSPGHCANMMNPDLKELGMAQYKNYWVQVFGTPKEE